MTFYGEKITKKKRHQTQLLYRHTDLTALLTLLGLWFCDCSQTFALRSWQRLRKHTFYTSCQRFFRMLRWLWDKKRIIAKKRYYLFTKSFVSVALLTSLGNYSHFTLFLPKKQTSRAALLWSGWSPRWLNMLSAGHTDSICLPLRCWWTIRPSCVQALK